MATTQASPLLCYIHHLAVCGNAGDVPDGALLERFVRHRDEEAFAALLRRHGAMVFGVCRRLLRDEQAAEDALQATFLVLATKAGSLRQSGSLGPWLHEVALRTARRARADAARRQAREAKAVVPVAYEDADDLVWRDLRPVLDDAIAALSDKYRVPFIRCYLEGETVAEVARQLGCPKGTIAVRLARAREQLRARLIRRGVSLSVSAFAAALATSELTAALLGPELRRTVTSTASAAIHRSTEVVAFAQVTGFTKGVWMMMSKVKVVGIVGIMMVAGAAMTASALAPQRAVLVSTPNEKPESEPPKKEDKKQETELESILRKWAEADRKVREMKVQVTIIDKDAIFQDTKTRKVQASLKKPDLFRLDLSDNKGGHSFIYLLESERLHVFQFEYKIECIFDMRGLNLFGRDKGKIVDKMIIGIWNSSDFYEQFRWATFGPQARDMDSRRKLHLAKQDQWYIYLDITPRNKDDKAWYARCRIVLEKKNYQVRQVWFEYATGSELFVDFHDRQINPQQPITRESLLKGLPKGWKRETLEDVLKEKK